MKITSLLASVLLVGALTCVMPALGSRSRAGARIGAELEPLAPAPKAQRGIRLLLPSRKPKSPASIDPSIRVGLEFGDNASRFKLERLVKRGSHATTFKCSHISPRGSDRQRAVRAALSKLPGVKAGAPYLCKVSKKVDMLKQEQALLEHLQNRVKSDPLYDNSSPCEGPDAPVPCHLPKAFHSFEWEGHQVLVLAVAGDYSLLEYRAKLEDQFQFVNLVHAEAWTRIVARQLVDVLAYLHENGIFHRNINPSNIRVTRGDPPHVTLIGFAKAYSTVFVGHVNYEPDVQVRSAVPGYAAPEIGIPDARLALTLDVDTLYALDSYSLAVTLFVFLTGKQPKDATDFYAKLDDEQLWKHYSTELRQFLRALSTRDPRQRLTMAQVRSVAWMMSTAGEKPVKSRKRSGAVAKRQ